MIITNRRRIETVRRDRAAVRNCPLGYIPSRRAGVHGPQVDSDPLHIHAGLKVGRLGRRGRSGRREKEGREEQKGSTRGENPDYTRRAGMRVGNPGLRLNSGTEKRARSPNFVVLAPDTRESLLVG